MRDCSKLWKSDILAVDVPSLCLDCLVNGRLWELSALRLSGWQSCWQPRLLLCLKCLTHLGIFRSSSNYTAEYEIMSPTSVANDIKLFIKVEKLQSIITTTIGFLENFVNYHWNPNKTHYRLLNTWFKKSLEHVNMI